VTSTAASAATTARGIALEASELSFTFPGSERPALERVSLRVREGATTGLLGPNGAGKTTFVHLVCGLLQPDSGTLRVFGRPGASEAARREIGFCPQELALYPTLGAAENLRFFGRLSGLSGEHLEARVAACLELARLGESAGIRVAKFSGGMKRRLNLAVALLPEPRLLLLDEPTVGVDAQSRLAIFEALERLAAGGTTIVHTTHYVEEIERLCAEVIVIDRGRVLAHGPTAEFVQLGRRAQTFRLTLAPGSDASALAREAEAGGVRARVLAEDVLELGGDDVAALTGAVARFAARRSVLGLETRRPTLEERFLELTGREMRD
jgi:ABC-2 type transport system ATP-binding protein